MKNFLITDKIREKLSVFLLLSCVLICIILNVYQFYRYGVYKKIDLSKFSLVDSKNFSWHIDKLDVKRDIYQITGWIIRNEEDIKTHDISLVIVNADGSSYIAPTKMVERKDVTKNKNKGDKKFNYDKSGFKTIVNKRYVTSSDSKIYIRYRNNQKDDIVDISKTFKGK